MLGRRLHCSTMVKVRPSQSSWRRNAFFDAETISPAASIFNARSSTLTVRHPVDAALSLQGRVQAWGSRDCEPIPGTVISTVSLRSPSRCLGARMPAVARTDSPRYPRVGLCLDHHLPEQPTITPGTVRVNRVQDARESTARASDSPGPARPAANPKARGGSPPHPLVAETCP